MVVRARPASSTPEKTVKRAEELTSLTLSPEGSDSEPAQNRRSGLGALLGIAAGLGTGAVYGLVRPRLGRVPFPVLASLAGLGANVGSVAPMTVLGSTTRARGRRRPGCPTWFRISPTVR